MRQPVDDAGGEDVAVVVAGGEGVAPDVYVYVFIQPYFNLEGQGCVGMLTACGNHRAVCLADSSGAGEPDILAVVSCTGRILAIRVVILALVRLQLQIH